MSEPRLRRTIFTGSGSWVAPAGVTFVTVYGRPGCGGGGGGAGGGGGGGTSGVDGAQGGSGGGAGSPGGSASLCEAFVEVTPNTSYTITIGAGGTGGANGTGGAGGSSAAGSIGTAGANGTDGGITSFGSVVSFGVGAVGGPKGLGGAPGNGGTLPPDAALGGGAKGAKVTNHGLLVTLQNDSGNGGVGGAPPIV